NTESDMKELVAELYVMRSLSGKCPYVIKYYEHYVLRYVNANQHRLSAYIFMELADSGTLMDEIIAGQTVASRSLTTRYFGEIVDGLEFMHRHGIAHNDFKPCNVLMVKDASPGALKHCKLS